MLAAEHSCFFPRVDTVNILIGYIFDNHMRFTACFTVFHVIYNWIFHILHSDITVGNVRYYSFLVSEQSFYHIVFLYAVHWMHHES